MTTERIIHAEVLDSTEVAAFVDVARRYCELVDRINSLTEPAFLQGVEGVLPLAYATAHALAWPWHFEGDDDDDDEDMREQPEPALPHGGYLQWHKHLWTAIGLKLGYHRVFHFVYDPSSPNEHDVIIGDLADCLADIYIDFNIGLMYYDRGTVEDRAEAVWKWKFGLEGFWGTHVAEVMLPIHHLLHTHYDEDEGTFRT